MPALTSEVPLAQALRNAGADLRLGRTLIIEAALKVISVAVSFAEIAAPAGPIAKW